MWSYLLHRVTGLAILLFFLMHLWEITSVQRAGAAGFDRAMAATRTPVLVVGEWLLFLALAFHGINGIRLLLHDLGWAVRRQQGLFWAVMAITALIVIPGSYVFAVRFLAFRGDSS